MAICQTVMEPVRPDKPGVDPPYETNAIGASRPCPGCRLSPCDFLSRCVHSGRSVCLRDCADRRSPPLVLLDRAGVPPEPGPGFLEQSAQDDDGVGQAGPGLLDPVFAVEDDLEQS